MRFQRPMPMIPALVAHSVVRIAFNRSSSRTWNPVAMSTLIARPIAARGVSHGRMPVAIGMTRPTDPSTSAVPIPRTRARGSLEKPVHRSRPRPVNFGNAAPRKKSARKICTPQRTAFTIPDLPNSYEDRCKREADVTAHNHTGTLVAPLAGTDDSTRNPAEIDCPLMHGGVDRGQRQIRNDVQNNEDPNRNGPSERTGFQREPRIRKPTVGWPQRPRDDDERQEHQRSCPRTHRHKVASQQV